MAASLEKPPNTAQVKGSSSKAIPASAQSAPVTNVTSVNKRIASLDFGNYALKVMTSEAEPPISIRSAHCEIARGQKPLASNESSPHVELDGKLYHVGTQALRYAANQPTVTQDKADLARLHMAATLTESGVYHLVVSHHSPDEYAQKLCTALIGRHAWRRNGIPVGVTVESVDVIPEGWGAYQLAKMRNYVPQRGYTVLIDLGGSTWLSSIYDESGDRIAHDTHDREGCYSLAVQISQDDRLKAALREGYRITAPDPSVIMDGFANQHYYAQTPICWGEWLPEYLDPWWKGIVSTLKSVYQHHLPNVQRFVVTGGASHLISAKVATSPAFIVMPDPSLSNVIGAWHATRSRHATRA